MERLLKGLVCSGSFGAVVRGVEDVEKKKTGICVKLMHVVPVMVPGRVIVSFALMKVE
jgi:hypothetical protein